MPFVSRLLRALAALGIAALAGCGSGDFEEPVAFEAPETLVTYEVVVEGAPSEEIAGLIEESLLLYRRQEDGAQSLAFLRRRAEGDVATIQKILRAYGYYRAEVTTKVRAVEPPAEATAAEAGEDAAAAPSDGADHAAAEAGEGAAGTDGPIESEAVAEVVITPGPAFTLARHDFALSGFEPSPSPALGPAAAYGSPVGAPAAAAAIVAAESAVVAAMREQGYGYAEARGRDAVADLERAEIEIDSSVETGRRYRLGAISFSGAPNVSEEYLRTYLRFGPGDLADRALLSAYQRQLLGTGLFRSGIVSLPETPPEGEVAPVTVQLEERPFRSVSAGARFSTDEGPGIRLGFQHRNLFGANERLDLTLDASIDEQVFNSTYRKPQYLRDGQDFVAEAEARRIEDDAFDEIGGTLTAGIQRKLSPRWTVGFGGLFEGSIIDDGETEATAYLFGIPLSAQYDGSDDLLNPTTGQRFGIELIPFGGLFDGRGVGFLSVDARASLYRRLDEDGRWVAAARTRLGAIPSGSLDDIPATRRLYSGGSGSVRGFQEDFVGPLDENNDPIGGRSVFELGAELRFPIVGDLGGVAFVEAGTVSTEIFPDFEEGMQVAAGAGVRYYSPIGPIRVDFGVPINGRDADDAFQFYISIGQAF
ncbi:MAG: BamA/TamA family outer membrane protein [Pseudomonadota bacterium]